jgi:hypothetical protein
MDRRAFLCALTVGTLSVPLVAEAQQPRTAPRIGYLSVSSASASGHLRKAFTEGLRDLGWTEGQNIVVEERWAEGNYARLVDQAVELVKLNVDAVVAAGPNPVIRAAKQATSAIPRAILLDKASSRAFNTPAETLLARPGTRTRGLPKSILSF